MAVPATRDVAILQGNIVFSAGGMSVDYLLGATVHSISKTEEGSLRIIGQTADGSPLDTVIDIGGGDDPGPNPDPQGGVSTATFNAEVAARKAADSQLQQNIADEATVSQAADAALGELIEAKRDVHYSFDLAYNDVTDQYDGTFVDDPASVGIGETVLFSTPAATPLNNLDAVLNIDIDGAETEFTLNYSDFSPVKNNELIPSSVFWGRVFAGLSIQLINPPGGSITRRTSRTITNAELKALDTNYIELVPAPGPDKFLQVSLTSIVKRGDDVPALISPRMYYVAISPDNRLSAAEVAAGNSATSGDVAIPTWPNGQTRYVFVGVPADRRDIVGFSPDRAGGETVYDFFTRVFERVAGTVADADGVAVKWWRTKVAYASPAAVGFESSDTVLGWILDNAMPTIDNIRRNAWAGMLFINDASLALPVHNHGNEYIWVSGAGLDTMLRAEAGERILDGVSHGLREDEALVLGAGDNVSRGNRYPSYSEAAFDAYMDPVDDVTLDVAVRYSILSI